MTSAHARFVASARDATSDPALLAALRDVTDRFAETRAAVVSEVPEWEALRERARQIKAAALARLDEHLLQFEAHVIAAGGTVHWAATPEEARRCVVELGRARGVSKAVKSKSMVSEEVHLNRSLEAAGITSTETDLGEYIIQLAGERPSHIIAPALHKSRADVGRLFAERFAVPFTDDVEALTAEARRRLRHEFFAAGMGISGANFLVAETGTIVIVENEGNARLCTSAPRMHVALAGIEKIVPRVADLAVFLWLLGRSATGQPMTSYVSLITGPRRPGERDGPDELHVVLLDNGRSRLLADPQIREALQCIRCGACQNVCPVYRNIGGHAYGGVYAGPIGAIVSAHLESSTAAPDLPFASTLCGACADVCPVKINIPDVLLHLRSRVMAGSVPDEPLDRRRRQRALMRAWALVMASPVRYRLASRVVRVALRLARRRRTSRWVLGALGAWTGRRDLPSPPARSFRQWWDVNRPTGP